ncbi:gp16 family protein [Gallibacterium anatis]|uniref:Mu-like prophage FluMu protein gp16 n=1 Tax=Gallibacterium anatis TaxID=750 RepID=A0A1A7P8N1_9PAST|nr:regulatory protein GemA [Gallibacterium anatis]OBW96683.1 Mu-like prophage FluMu protein gp16 [Gallibacterium anatis]OBW98071.1 Mu-like prophage FluMu protein gp16 [Gallibacterium anatis]
MRYTKPKLIQLIHIAKHKLRIDEETYRLILCNETGKNSCKEMNITELMKVFDHFEQAGFKHTTKRQRSPASQKAKVKHNIALKIRAVWIEMHKQGVIREGSEDALNSFVRNVVNPILQQQDKPIVLNVQSLDYKLGTIVLERLKKWQQRTQKEVK